MLSTGSEEKWITSDLNEAGGGGGHNAIFSQQRTSITNLSLTSYHHLHISNTLGVGGLYLAAQMVCSYIQFFFETDVIVTH